MRKTAAVVMLALTAFLSTAGTLSADEHVSRTRLVVPVTGTAVGGSFTGTFTLREFVRSGQGLAAAGVLTGTVTEAGGATTSVVQTVLLPLQVTEATCDILNLVLGPLSLDLLGLQVDLSRIVLNITAESGPGNLLGNLLCSISRLLDNPSSLVRALNRILAALA